MKAKLIFLLKYLRSRFTKKREFAIVRGYFHRREYSYFNDTSLSDEFQNEVYQFASNVFQQNQYKTILDFGCGSGFKLMKYFGSHETIGLDVDETVAFLKGKYPDRKWHSISHDLPQIEVDMVICSDVIEHVLDPVDLINKIKTFKPKVVFISTPDRKLTDFSDYFGPPRNPTHIREWTFHEFREFLSQHFVLQEHFIIHYDHRTQLAMCRLA